MVLTFLNSETANAAGWTFSGLAIWFKSLELFNGLDLAIIWDVIMALGAGAFLFFKAWNLLLDAQGKILDNKKKRKDLAKKMKGI